MELPRIAVVTATFGGSDSPRKPSCHENRSLSYLCFTDAKKLPLSSTWSRVLVEPSDAGPRMDAKRIKILIHEHVDADVTVWIDAHCRLKADPVEILAEMDAAEADVAFVRHQRTCLYREAEACITRRKDNKTTIRAQTAAYRESGHPKAWGAFFGGCIFRRHTAATERFNEHWWREVSKWSFRDQIALPFSLRETGIKLLRISRSRRPRMFEICPKRRRR